MDSYSRIKFNVKTANRFRKFSGQIAGSHSETLTIMMDFFDQNKISPSESLGPNMKSLENNLKRDQVQKLWDFSIMQKLLLV